MEDGMTRAEYEGLKKILKMFLEQYCKKRQRKKILQNRMYNLKKEFGENISLDYRIKCEEIERRIEEEQKETAIAMLKIMDVLDFLEKDSLEKEILEYKYLDSRKWIEIEKVEHLSRSRCIDYWNRGLNKLLEFKYVRQIIAKYKEEMLGRAEKERISVNIERRTVCRDNDSMH